MLKLKKTKKYIAKCYDCDLSVGGPYPEQDKEMTRAVQSARYDLTSADTRQPTKSEIINKVFENIN